VSEIRCGGKRADSPFGMAVAQKTIATMVLISLDPFASRKIILIIAALLGFSALCFGDPILMAQRYETRAHNTNSADHGIGQIPFPESSDSSETAKLENVDLRSREQELSFSHEQAVRPVFPQPNFLFSVLEFTGSICD